MRATMFPGPSQKTIHNTRPPLSRQVQETYEQICVRGDGVHLMQVLRALQGSSGTPAAPKKKSRTAMLQSIQNGVFKRYATELTSQQLTTMLVWLEERSVVRVFEGIYLRTEDGENLMTYAYRQATQRDATSVERRLVLTQDNTEYDELW